MEDIYLDFINRRVEIAGNTHRLTEIEFRLMWELNVHAGKVVAYDTLLERVWGEGYRNELKYLQDYIRLLRRKIEPDPQNPRYILNIRDYGYLLNLPPHRSAQL
ncbi:MAG: helix-turn-helix domain-containing protein [Dehalococcoidales bacterium]|nr:helix-turn-helix domain-containing protein [Dehalococcoidales bacterium]